ncbi:MAG: hypothetical protein ACI9FB_003691 [Candidatus Azotimanducaceae bacterium]|jgi:hypothetical protein
MALPFMNPSVSNSKREKHLTIGEYYFGFLAKIAAQKNEPA